MAEQSNTIGTDLGGFDGAATVEGLNRFLRLRTTPIVMKRFRTVEEMNAVPKIRRPDAVHTMDQIVGQAARNGWTVGSERRESRGRPVRHSGRPARSR